MEIGIRAVAESEAGKVETEIVPVVSDDWVAAQDRVGSRWCGISILRTVERVSK